MKAMLVVCRALAGVGTVLALVLAPWLSSLVETHPYLATSPFRAPVFCVPVAARRVGGHWVRGYVREPAAAGRSCPEVWAR